MKFWRYKPLYGLVAQLVRAPPCHGGGHGFESRLGRFSNCFTITVWDLSSAGRASALQAEGHRFEPCRSHSCRRGGTGRRAGLKILLWWHSTGSIPVAGITLWFIVLSKYVCVAQMDRALGYGPRCREFESSRARMINSLKFLKNQGFKAIFVYADFMNPF